MQNKKLLSVCLTVLLVCICLVGVFSLSVSAVTPVTWKVTGTANAAAGEYATLQAAIDAAAAKTDWQGTDELTIEITTSAAQKFDYANGILFEVNTIFTQANTKLPIIIKGGEIDVSHVPTGKDAGPHTLIACSNDYTFKNLKMLLGEKNIDFYSGSGEVVFDNCVVYEGSDHKVRFYGDNNTALAFAGWTQANVDAEKGEDGLIPVSLTFRETDYALNSKNKSRFSVVGEEADFAAPGDLISADDLNVGFTIEDSVFCIGAIRRVQEDGTQALSPVGKLTFNVIDTSSDNSKTKLLGLNPIGYYNGSTKATNSTPIRIPDFDVEINIEGGDLSNAAIDSSTKNYSPVGRFFLISGVEFNGNVDINISGGKFPAEDNFMLNKARVNGDVSIDISDCTLGKIVCMTYGEDSSAANALTTNIEGNVYVNLTRCNFPSKTYIFYGTKLKGDAFINVDGGTYGAEFNIAEGDKSTRAAGNVITNVTGGTFATLRGSFAAGRGVPEGHDFRNEMNLSNCTVTTYQGSRQCPGETGRLVNNVYDGAVITTFWGAYVSASSGGGNYGYIENNVYGGEITTFNGGGQLKAGYATDIINNINDGKIGTFVGAGNADVKGTLTNNISGGTIEKYIGTTDGIHNDEVINVVYNNLTGGTITGSCYSTGNQPTKEVYNAIDGILIKGAFYGTYGQADEVENHLLSGEVRGVTVGTKGTSVNVTNYIKGGRYCTDTSSRKYFQGTGGTTTGTVTNIIDGDAFFADNTYLTGDKTVSNTVVNHFHKGAFTKPVYGPNGPFDTTTNHFYGTYTAKANHLGVAGTTTAISSDQQRLVVNNFYPGAKFATFYGADLKNDNKVCVAKIINNVDGASFERFYGVGFRGAVYEVENNVTGEANFDLYCGGYSLGLIKSGSTNPSVIDSKITNNIYSGTFTAYIGGNGESHRDFSNDTIVNNIYGGTFNGATVMGSNVASADAAGTVTAAGDWGDYEITNNIYGGTFNKRVYGTGIVSCKSVTSNLHGGDFLGSFSGTYNSSNADLVVNNVYGGTYDVAGGDRYYFYGTGESSTANKVVNTYNGDAVFNENMYGSRGKANVVENHYYAIGDFTAAYGDWGATELVQNYFHDGFYAHATVRGNRGTAVAVAAGVKREVESYFYNCDFSGAAFYGMDGGAYAFPTASKVSNFIMGGVYKEFVAGGGRGDTVETFNVITGNAEITTFYGGNTSNYVDSTDAHLEAVFATTIGTETDPFTGRIKTFYGGNRSASKDDIRATITNTVNSGTIDKFVGGSAAGTDGSVANLLNGGTFEGIVHAGANDAVIGGAASVDGAVDLAINGGIYSGTVTTVAGGPVKVSGTIGVTSEAQIVATEGANVTLVQYEEWLTGHKYLVLPESALLQAVILNNDATVNGQGVADRAASAIVGFSVPRGGVMASLSLEEKMVVKIWFPKADIDTYLEMFGKPFEYEAILDDNGNPVSLAKGAFNAPRRADVTYDGTEYYLVPLSGIGAGSFNKTFTVTGSSMAFSNSILNLVSEGIKAYAGKEVEPLFQSIYDYGASACGVDTRYDFLTYNTELPAPVVSKADNAVVNFSDVTALMGDAIGIRFIGTAGASFDPAAIVVKLDGAALANGTDYRIVNEAGNVYIDIYFKAAFMSTDMTVTIEAGGVTAFHYQFSVERTVANIVRLAPRNEKAITLLVYIQQAKAYLA